MKLPDIFSKIISPKPKVKGEVYLSLLIDTASVGVSVWERSGGRVTTLGKPVVEALLDDTWEGRINASKKACETLGESSDVPDVEQAILGLSSLYVTADGAIEKHIRPHVRDLMAQLEIKPIGFVPIADAIIHHLKAEEGVPANAILIELLGKDIGIYLYKIGKHIGRVRLEHKERIIETIDKGIRAFAGEEVLPSRMLVFGGTTEQRDEVARALLKHPWQNLSNFLHFPKIEALGSEALVSSITTAGISELADEPESTEGAETEQVETATSPTQEPQERDLTQNVYAQKAEVSPPVSIVKKVTSRGADDSIENVVMVEPEALGFKKQPARDDDANYALAQRSQQTQPQNRPQIAVERDVEEREEGKSEPGNMLEQLAKKLPDLSSLKIGPIVILLVGLVLISGIILAMNWFMPSAKVQVFLTAKIAQASNKITIDPAASAVDIVTMTIPGKKIETKVTGSKTLPVSGKKKIGDPAKGVVTIFNKTLASRTLKKGTVLVSGNLKFTLDSEVLVASAADSFASGSRTFGQVKAAATAGQIGAGSNLPADSVFTFDAYDSSVLIARNEQPFTGGTSREATVVTRSDYDALVTAITKELVAQAKTDLNAGVGGGDQLVEDTVTTSIAEKTFAQELDQEVTEVSGTVGLSVSGIAFRQTDAQALLLESLKNTLPPGYTLAPETIQTTIADLKVKKDGKIDATSSATAKGYGVIDETGMRKQIVGKSVEEATKILSAVDGVGGVAITFKLNPVGSIPANPNNISFQITPQ